MAASVNTSGSQTAVISTQHVLATITAAGTYQLVIDMSAMAGGTTPDELRVFIFGKARSSDAEVTEEVYHFIGAQSKPLWRSPPVWSPHYFKVAITQTAGTGRAFPWAVFQP